MIRKATSNADSNEDVSMAKITMCLNCEGG